MGEASTALTEHLCSTPRHRTAYLAAGPADGPLLVFLHAAYDWICETQHSRLAEPMRRACAQLSEAVVESGHWMQQEKPAEVHAHLARWLAQQGWQA